MAGTRWLAAAGSLLAAAGVAVSAYAAHAVQGDARSALYTAAVLAFGHGIALAALAPRTATRLGLVALWGLLSGTVLFSGSLVLDHALGLPVALAPFGGSLLILSWLLHAAAGVRH